MRAAVNLGPRRMEIQEVPEPIPDAGETLVRIEAVGICGSDLHLYLGDHPYARFPQTRGHELSGIVQRFGGDYAGPLRRGDRVAVEPVRPCGECYPCREGRYNCCTRLAVLGAHVPGGMSELRAVRPAGLYPAGDLDPELTVMCEPISIGLQAAVRGQVRAGEAIVVYGAGPIGQAALLASVDRGARVLAVDRIPARLELASALGAEAVVDVGAESAPGRIAAWTGGDGPAVVFDATGVPAVIREAVEVVASAGRVVIVGISDLEVSLPVIDFTRKELTILGSRNSAGIFGDAVALVQRHRERVRRLITHRFRLEEAAQALEFAIEHPAEAEKVIIMLGDAP